MPVRQREKIQELLRSGVVIAAEDSRLYTCLCASRGFRRRRQFSHFVSGDLELVTVGIAKVNGVRDFVVLEFEIDSALFQFTLRGEKILFIRAKGEVKHPKFAVA